MSYLSGIWLVYLSIRSSSVVADDASSSTRYLRVCWVPIFSIHMLHIWMSRHILQLNGTHHNDLSDALNLAFMIWILLHINIFYNLDLNRWICRIVFVLVLH